jgi:electron transport complex protein RnfD
MSDKKLYVKSPPYIHSGISTAKIMWAVVLALVPSAIAAVWYFRFPASVLILVCVLSCVATEFVIQKLRKVPVTISDGSAVLTGVLLAFSLPPLLPVGIAALGSFFAIAIVKQTFGGLGCNIFNPALAGRVFLLTSFPKAMTSWSQPISLDAISSATPLAIQKLDLQEPLPNIFDMLIGNRAGSIGETMIVFLILGGIFLIYKQIITWHIPVGFILTAGVLGWMFEVGINPLFYIAAGGLVLGAVFMATDYVTSPITGTGKLIFGFGCGLITFLIRRFSGDPEGVAYSILFMNCFVPLIDRLTQARVFGVAKRNVSL